jgi:hypothetical protein
VRQSSLRHAPIRIKVIPSSYTAKQTLSAYNADQKTVGSESDPFVLSQMAWLLANPRVASDADSKDADNYSFTGRNGLPLRCLVFSNKQIGSPSPPDFYAKALVGMNTTPSLMM